MKTPLVRFIIMFKYVENTLSKIYEYIKFFQIMIGAANLNDFGHMFAKYKVI